MLMLYQGLKPNRYYWEAVNTLRKMLLLAINVFLSSFSLYYKCLSSVTMLTLILTVHNRLQPYQKKINNDLEKLEMTASWITLFSGVIFIEDEDNDSTLNSLIFLFTYVINIRFVVFWTYWIASTYKQKFRVWNQFASILSFILCIKSINTENNPRTGDDIK
jgi:hypothetical protein